MGGMAENEDKPKTIPSLDDVGAEMTDEQRERQAKQPGPGSPGQAAPEGDTPSPAESTPKIGDQGEGTGDS